MKILITGATGYVGGQLLPRLLESGHEVTCMVRDASKLSRSLGLARISRPMSFTPEVCLQ